MVENKEEDNESRIRSDLFEALSHETRIRILQTLGEQPMTFAGLKRTLQIESSGNLQHHLGKLGDLVRQTDDGLYALTDDAREALRTLKAMKDFERVPVAHLKVDSENRWWMGNFRLFPLVMLKALLIASVGVIAYASQQTTMNALLLGFALSLGFAYVLGGLLGRVTLGRRAVASMAFLLLASSFVLYACAMYFSTIAVSGLWNVIMATAFVSPLYFFLTYRFLEVYESRP